MSTQTLDRHISDIDTVVSRLEHWGYIVFGPPNNGLCLFGAPLYCSTWREVEQVIWLSIAGRPDWQLRLNELLISSEARREIWDTRTPGTIFTDATSYVDPGQGGWLHEGHTSHIFTLETWRVRRNPEVPPQPVLFKLPEKPHFCNLNQDAGDFTVVVRGEGRTGFNLDHYRAELRRIFQPLLEGQQPDLRGAIQLCRRDGGG